MARASFAIISRGEDGIYLQHDKPGVVKLRSDIAERALRLAEYITENRATVRAAAKAFGISKSTVHKDVTERLAEISPELCAEVRELLDRNKAERHIRGGMATREKFAHMTGRA